MLNYIVCMLFYILPVTFVVTCPLLALILFAADKVKEAKKKKAWQRACHKQRMMQHALALRHLKATLKEK